MNDLACLFSHCVECISYFRIGKRNKWSVPCCWLMLRERTLSPVTIGICFELDSSWNSGDVTKESADAFCSNVIAKKDTGSKPPITYIDGTTFIYVRNADHYIVAVTKKNASPGMDHLRSELIDRSDLPLPLPPREDVQELFRSWVQGCMGLWKDWRFIHRITFVISSLWCTKFSMVCFDWKEIWE